MEELTETERKIIDGLLLEGKSMRELSTELDLVHRRVHGFLQRALRKIYGRRG